MKVKLVTSREVRKKGKKDGRDWRFKWGWPFRESKQSQPGLAQAEAAPYERELAGIASRHLEEIRSEWAETDKDLLKAYCHAKSELKNAETSCGKESAESERARAEHEDACREFSSIPPVQLSNTAYFFAILFLFICEFPLNSIVMEIFGRSQAETWIMAGSLCFGILVLAHLVGHSYKRSVKKVPLIIAGIVVALGIIGVISLLREKFFEAQGTEDILGISISPVAMTLIFIVINLAIFAIASWLAYENGHTDPERYKVAQRRLLSATVVLGKEAGEAQAAQHRLEEAQRELTRAQTLRQKAFEKTNHSAAELKATLESLIWAYRDANLSARRDKTMPESFKRDVDAYVNIPQELVGLKWECPNINAGSN